MDETNLTSIPRDYLQTFMRRADHSARSEADFVTIPKTEHDDLLRISHEYKALLSALIAGGLSPDNLNILINITASADSNQCENSPSPKPSPWSAEAPAFVPTTSAKRAGNAVNDGPSSHAIPPTPPSLSNEMADEELEVYHEEEVEECYEEEEYYENNHDDRSIVLRGLAPSTTLADIAKVVRGGLVLNMFMRPRERTAHVAFVDPMAAEKFLIYSKRNDIYIKGKRIEVYWDERQHWMPGHIARRLENGATRNLVVRFANPTMTSESIREDLEHIHNLDVVDIAFKDGHAFISTNGIGWAITARTCMSSRLKYKGTKIKFFPDECDEPLPPVTKRQAKSISVPKSKAATIPHMNRFAMLVEEGEERFEEVHTANGALSRSASGGL